MMVIDRVGCGGEQVVEVVLFEVVVNVSVDIRTVVVDDVWLLDWCYWWQLFSYWTKVDFVALLLLLLLLFLLPFAITTILSIGVIITTAIIVKYNNTLLLRPSIDILIQLLNRLHRSCTQLYLRLLLKVMLVRLTIINDSWWCDYCWR